MKSFSIRFLLFLSLVTATPALAGWQDSAMLAIGDLLPEATLTNVLNYEQDVLRLSDFKGKLLILDFWAVSCAPCIAAMPKMQALQEKYADQLQVVLVTADPKDKVTRLFGRLNKLKSVTLPSVVSDTVLGPRFAFRAVPTHVWISPEGRIVQITQGFNTTEEKIAAYLDGEAVLLPVRQQHKDFDFKTPLWMEGDGRQQKYLKYYSYIMDYTPDAGGMIGVNKDQQTGKNVRVVVTNNSLLELCKVAYGESTLSPDNPFTLDSRVKLKVTDSSRFHPPQEKTLREQWRQDHVYCYELVVPPEKSAQLFTYMRQDLARYFGVYGNIEQHTMPCLVLKRTGDSDLLASRGGTFMYKTNHGQELNIRNLPVSWLMRTLSTYLGSMPILDETGYDGNIDIDLVAELSNRQEVNKALQPYGLTLVMEDRTVSVLALFEGE